MVIFLSVFSYRHHYQSTNTTTETLITASMTSGQATSSDIDPVVIILKIHSYPNFRVPDARTFLLRASSGALRPKLLNYIHFREETYMLFKKKRRFHFFFLLN